MVHALTLLDKNGLTKQTNIISEALVVPPATYIYGRRKGLIIKMFQPHFVSSFAIVNFHPYQEAN